tara:strand:+ start:1661 stop:2590 length:930 start_codon:yes stop_codon:yes gene_type:complete
MKFLKPKFWDRKYSLLSFLLLPLSLVLQLLNVVKEKLTKVHKFTIPVVCVGNIYIGGTGKTPLSIFIAKELIKQNKRPALIKKYYLNHLDEHKLIRKNLDCLFLNKKRSTAIYDAEKSKYNIAILDDGFQDHSINKNLNILCFNSSQLIGNGMTIPSGPLRENIKAVRKAQIILINGEKNEIFEKKILSISSELEIFYSKYSLINIENLKNKKLFAFAGIGNPSNFFKLLLENNLNVQKQALFPDHYQFKKSEVQQMIDLSLEKNFELVTTEKDYLRIEKFGLKNINYIKVQLEIFEKNKFINQILKCL